MSSAIRQRAKHIEHLGDVHVSIDAAVPEMNAHV
jgi:hypothetical protein